MDGLGNTGACDDAMLLSSCQYSITLVLHLVLDGCLSSSGVEERERVKL